MNPELLPYIVNGISVITAVIAVLSVQLKNMKGILATQLIGNTLAASTYFLMGGFFISVIVACIRLDGFFGLIPKLKKEK
jgi:hypothetical protein